MNDLTLPAVAKDLWLRQLGEGKFGIETTQEPSFPLQGMLWWSKHRAFFEMTGIYKTSKAVPGGPRLPFGP